jgi:anti-anti-sigma factor
MISTELSIRGRDGHVVVALRGELDLSDAGCVAAALTAVADREPWIVVDLTGLSFIDVAASSGTIVMTLRHVPDGQDGARFPG